MTYVKNNIILIAIAIALMVSLIYYHNLQEKRDEYYQIMNPKGIQILDKFTQNKDAFYPKYSKELDLFKTMSYKEQQEYLDLSKDAKFAKYGPSLL